MISAARISVIIITLNEERNIEACIQSVLAISDDIIVIDSGSSDRTLEIAQRYTSKVYVQDWQGDGPQRQFGVPRASHEWILNIDADERLLPEQADTLLEIAWSGSPLDAFYLRRKNILHGRWVRHSGWYPDLVLRFFHRERAHFSDRAVHTKLIARKTGRIPAMLVHYSYRDYAQMLEKMNVYSSISAGEIVNAGRQVHVWEPLSHGFWMFFRVYFLKLGFRDGVDGAAIALTSALGSFMKYAKALEMQNQRTDERSSR